MSDAAGRVEGQPMFKILARANELAGQGRSILHFEIGEPDFETPLHIAKAGVEAIKTGDTHYVPSMGILELRDSVCKYIEREYGFRPKREQVLICPGANPIISYAMQAVVNPGEQVIVQDPGFPSYYSAMTFNNIVPNRVPVWEENHFRMDPVDIKERMNSQTRLIMMNSPQNPTGAVMTKEEVESVYDIAQEEDVFLLSDEIYGKMTYDVPHHSPIHRDKCNERTILLNGFSKAYSMTGWRLGYAVGPADIIEKMGLILSTEVSCVPPFVQRAGIAALEGDQGVIAEMMKHFRQRRDLIVEGLNSLPGVSCIVPGGAFYAFPNVKNTGMTDVEFTNFMLEEAGVATCPGSYFGGNGAGFVRFSYASSLEAISEAINRMRTALESRKVK
ncbi:MAG TPA: pyridoxal phosphate-dependent aminotransferase [Euryarchaeota archaeon]|nr:pyridoxal phosphate-dependent aminotransferase [Euryarchaeota archaeon]